MVFLRAWKLASGDRGWAWMLRWCGDRRYILKDWWTNSAIAWLGVIYGIGRRRTFAACWPRLNRA